MFIYLITEFTESWDGEKVEKSIHRRYYATRFEVVSIAKNYYHNSDVEEEIDLDNLQNAIAFIERVDKVERCKVTLEEVYSPSSDITTIFEYTENELGESIRMEIKGFYHGKPDDECTSQYYGANYWDTYGIK